MEINEFIFGILCVLGVFVGAVLFGLGLSLASRIYPPLVIRQITYDNKDKKNQE